MPREGLGALWACHQARPWGSVDRCIFSQVFIIIAQYKLVSMDLGVGTRNLEPTPGLTDHSVKSSRSSRSQTLKRYVERADDELNSAEAMKALKKAHKKNKTSGRKVLDRIVQLSESDGE